MSTLLEHNVLGATWVLPQQKFLSNFQVLGRQCHSWCDPYPHSQRELAQLLGTCRLSLSLLSTSQLQNQRQGRCRHCWPAQFQWSCHHTLLGQMESLHSNENMTSIFARQPGTAKGVGNDMMTLSVRAVLRKIERHFDFWSRQPDHQVKVN